MRLASENDFEVEIRSRLTLTTFGAVTLYVTRPGADPQLIPLVGKQLALITYLACAPRYSASRDHLIDLLWEGAPRDKGQNALRDLLRRLKEKIDEGWLGLPASDPVALTLPVECDRNALIAAHQRGDSEAVVELYGGEFLPNLDGIKAEPFRTWLEGQRANLRRIFVQSAREVVRERLSSWRTREALTVARRVRDHDELDEANWRLVIECLMALGDTVGIAVEDEKLRRLLAKEELEPEEATRVLLGEALGVPAATSAEPAGAESCLVADLIGRENEFSGMLREWQEARHGSFRLIHVLAPAGLAKTRLLADSRARLHTLRAREERARSAHARGSYGTREFPLAFASDFARALLDRRGGAVERRRAIEIPDWAKKPLVALNPTLVEFFPAVSPDNATGAELPRRVSLALFELLRGVAVDGPLAVFLDDLHWAHPDSLRLLAATFSKSEKLPILVVSASRTPCEELSAATHGKTMVLAPLSTESVVELLSSLAPLPGEEWAGRFARALCDATAGSPLLVLETLQLLMEQELLERSVDGWSAADPDALFEILGRGSAVWWRVARLEPAERRILLLLAISGVPVNSRVLASAAGVPLADLAAALTMLEQRGIITRQGDQWRPGHDEHAAAVVAAEPGASLGQAAVDVGRALAADPHADAQELAVAGPLLARGGTEAFPALSRAFERFARAKRLAGDGRPDRLLAGELLGATATKALASRLVHSLPWLVRLRLVSGRRIAAATMMFAILLLGTAAIVVALTRPPVRPDAVLVAYWHAEGGSGANVVELPIYLTRWNDAAAFAIDLSHRARWRTTDLQLPLSGLRPDGRGWTSWHAAPDSDGLDIFDLTLDGREQRITFTPRDDMSPTWAPDMSRFAFTTARWNDQHRHDIAVRDVRTGSEWQLTSGDDNDGGPMWSPDGTRIAFVRSYWGAPRSVCVMHADGRELRCISGFGVLGGWSDSRRVLVLKPNGGVYDLILLDVDSGEETLLETNATQEATVSPDGRFVLCICRRDRESAPSWIVYPIDRPNDFRTLHVIGVNHRELVNFTWSPTTPRSPFLSSARIEGMPGSPVVGITYQLRVSGSDTAGRSVEPRAVRWRSLDTAIATVDSTGLLMPRRVGHARVEASAGGWRTVQDSFPVVEGVSEQLFAERWQTGLGTTWVPFGDSLPATVQSEVFGPAFNNRGGKYFYIGAYTRQPFDTQRGLWVEGELSTPLTPCAVTNQGEGCTRWQTQEVWLFTPVDSAAWAAWDGRRSFAPSATKCRFEFPWGDVISGQELMRLTAATSHLDVRAPASLRTGRPFRMLIQIFPDGRCGYALDGEPLWVSPPGYYKPTAHVLLEGRSVDTDILVGPLRVFSGIAPHVTWSAVDSVHN